MFIFKRKPSLTEYDMVELKDIVARTVELALESNEETIHFLKQYDLILILSWEFDYMECSIYQYSTFEISKNGSSRFKNLSLYMEKRDLIRKDDTVIYIDDENIKNLSKRNLLAFYSLSELINIFDVEVHANNLYKCIW
ncbi:hypothetical protein QMA09_05200 [Planococcus sp. APC 3906]|uniref:hypothetical protein n=1 Tax=Planococcus sp. APC 3906 TaxID=3035194 RepID=UPI0025B383DC|nr:hypothetical protein [Planococcus sp. APC 3906]MDN3449574.1 hypothetical protein [Planococcus sp. APC 3906]